MLDLCNFAEIYILVSPTKKIYRPSEPPGAKIEYPISTPGAETVEFNSGLLQQLQESRDSALHLQSCQGRTPSPSGVVEIDQKGGPVPISPLLPWGEPAIVIDNNRQILQSLSDPSNNTRTRQNKDIQFIILFPSIPACTRSWGRPRASATSTTFHSIEATFPHRHSNRPRRPTRFNITQFHRRRSTRFADNDELLRLNHDVHDLGKRQAGAQTFVLRHPTVTGRPPTRQHRISRD